MAAARTLLQEFPQIQVTLLEAKDRFGGRIHSVRLDEEADDNGGGSSSTRNASNSIWADLGGMFWHGHSAVYQSLAHEFPHVESIASGGDSKIPAQDCAMWLRYPAVGSNVNARPQPVTAREIHRSQVLYQAWETAMHKRYQQHVQKQVASDANAFPISTEAETSELLASWSADFCKTLTQPLDRDLLQLRLTMSFEMDRGMPWEKHTLASLDQDWDWIDVVGDDVIARHGMQGWVTALVDDIRNRGGQLLLNQRVNKIDYGDWGNNASQVACTVTTEEGRVFAADYVVVALPLGVLKDKATHLFSPPLPCQQMDALDRAGVGVLNTLLVRWNRPLSLPGKSNAYYFLQSKHADNPLRHGFCCPSHLRQDHEKNPNTITQFHFSETNHPFDDIEFWKARAFEIVQDVVDEPLTVHDILVAHVSQWHLDPDIRGAYSAATTRTRGNMDRMILGTPVARRVFFAGEHTHTGGRYQSMDGAYETGVRAAREILDALSEAKLLEQTVQITKCTQRLATCL